MSEPLAELLDLYDPTTPLDHAYDSCTVVPDARLRSSSATASSRATGSPWDEPTRWRPGGVLHHGACGGAARSGTRRRRRLRAFYNVCRHHAAAVMTAPCGKASICAALTTAGRTAWTAR